jgi:alkylation response protein AidB-like acyl-CoA dehydrogenase
METIEAPPRTELAERARELVPLLRSNALWADENRRLSEDTVAALTDAGLLRMRIPTRYGGHESDLSTVVDVISELGRGDGSTSWTVAVWSISSWLISLFPDEVQDEVFATPDVRVGGILSPGAVAVPTNGGVVLNGRWSFNTGALQSQWDANAAVRVAPDGAHEPVLVAVPISDLEVIDDWHTAGLRGTGSVTTVAKDLFVPEARVLSMGPVLQGPFMPTACTKVTATALGLAKAARDAFFERLPGRKITYTGYDDQSQAPLTHLQVAEASVKVDEAEFHAYRAAGMVDSKGTTDWTLEERARVRLDMGATCQRAKEAVDILNTASGASSVYRDVPIQRIERDVQTLCLHGIMHPNTNLELYGRILCGLAPNTLYL